MMYAIINPYEYKQGVRAGGPALTFIYRKTKKCEKRCAIWQKTQFHLFGI